MRDYYSQIQCDTPDLCRFAHGPSSSTLLGWFPEYNREGKLLNTDPNITSHHMKCNHCGREFSVKSQFNETEVIELKQLLNE